MTIVHRTILTGLLATVVAMNSAVADEPLPAPLELRYVLRYGTITVGNVHKTLMREANGQYRHRSHSVPKGMARWFTEVEWFEEGQFEIVDGKIRPLRFLEYRVGADRSHRHEAVFDWQERVVRYASGARASLPVGAQDQGSLVFALMLHPPAPGTEPEVAMSTGKKLSSYRYTDRGAQTLETAFGPLKTRVIERITRKPNEEGFRIWLATDHRNLPVRITTTKRGQETAVELEAMTGAITIPRRSH